jgi:hypothetical protein
MRLNLAAAAICAAALALQAPVALADPVASTGPATSITTTSAMLNGVIDPSNPDSEFAFEYGPSIDYSYMSAVEPARAGLQAVAVTITGLKPATTYHYRAVVLQLPYGLLSDTGQDMTFTTAQLPPTFGKASLVSSKLRVKHRKRRWRSGAQARRVRSATG